MYDYTTYKQTVAAVAPLHGICRIEPVDTDGAHRTKKIPLTKHGVYDFVSRADEIEIPADDPPATFALCRRFGAGNIIGIDCDGWIPPEDWTLGTGYRETSSSGTGAHIIVRVAGELPHDKNKDVISAQKGEAYGLRGETELFLGSGNWIALTGIEATAGDIDLDASSECARFLYRRFEDLIQAHREHHKEEKKEEEAELVEHTEHASQTEEHTKVVVDKVFLQHLRVIDDLIADYAVPSNPRIPSNPSEAMMWTMTYAASKLRELERNVGRGGLLRVDVLRTIWRHTGIYIEYYKGNPKYASNYEQKELRSIEKCISRAIADAPRKRERRSIKDICMGILRNDYKDITYEDKESRYVNRNGLLRALQRELHTTMIADTRDGSVWHDGKEWHVDGTSIVQRTEISGIINRLSERGVNVKGSKDITVSQVASMKTVESTVAIDACYSRGLTCTDGVLIVDFDGIHITEHDPFKDVWFGSAPVSVSDVTVDLEDIREWKEKKEEFKKMYPNFFRVLDACGEDKVDLFASMAGVAIYYTMPNHKPLDVWYYLWDANVAGTGKSTHIKMFTSLFGNYVASGVSWKTFVGADSENNSLMGKIGCVCEEAGLNEIRSIEAIKSRTSGGWELKKLFRDKVGINEPLLMISLGNVKPLLKQNANTPAIWDRLQPCEFDIKHRGTGDVFDCSEDEYQKALLNIGVWVAHKLFQNPQKSTLPYFVPSEEVRRLCMFVPFRELIPELGEHVVGKETPLKILFKALKAELASRGFGDIKGAPELKSEKAFAAYLNDNILEFEEPADDSGYRTRRMRYRLTTYSPDNTLIPTKRRFSRFWVRNFRMDDKYYDSDELKEYLRIVESSSYMPDGKDACEET